MLADNLILYYLKFPNDKITVHWKNESSSMDDTKHGWRYNHVTKEVYNLDDLDF